jgi:hypothetical protein
MFQVPRPFRISLGTTGCILYLVTPVAGILLILSLASYTTMLFGLAVNAVGLVLYYCRQGSFGDYCCRSCRIENKQAVEYEVIDLNLTTADDLPPVA